MSNTDSETEDTEQIKFLTSWFCPYAQRVWIALLHKQASFKHIEQDPYDKKNPELLAVNPKAMVPAILLDNGKLIYESAICVEYVDERWRTDGKTLLPSDPYERAYSRYWGQYVTKFGGPLYQILKKRDEEREQAKRDMVINLQAILQVFRIIIFISYLTHIQFILCVRKFRPRASKTAIKFKKEKRITWLLQVIISNIFSFFLRNLKDLSLMEQILVTSTF